MKFGSETKPGDHVRDADVTLKASNNNIQIDF
ncbi:Protein of unknown function [Bacillus cereus]|nr:Protein of unknown function [Bacillus cereus]